MLFSSPQDVASHQPNELVARIEGCEWSGKLHLGRFEARIVLVKVFCCVFSLGQDHKLSLWLVCDEDGSRLVVFFCLCRALSVFSYIFI